MASLYRRGDSIWLNYRAPDGTWKNKSTGYRHSNSGERRQAQRLKDETTLRERIEQPIARGADWTWVLPWIETRFGHLAAATLDAYRKRWRNLSKWLVARDLPSPANITRDACMEYPTWRLSHGTRRNTAIGELRFLSLIMDEAIRRGMAQANAVTKLGLSREQPKAKRTWTSAELDLVDCELLKRDPLGWMRVSFLLGRYQAARLRSCSLPLDDIDLERGTIYFAEPKGGRKRAYTQPIDKRLLPALREIVEHRRTIGVATLCDIPFQPSVAWRQFLDSIGVRGVSHHDLRSSWVVRAAMSGIPESVAQKFSNHSSNAVHRIYARFSTEDMATMLERLKT